MSGGGKGGSQTTQVQIPKWLEDGGKRALAKGEKIAELGYMPWYGPDVAALSGDQEAAMRNTSAAAQAFGMGSHTPMGGMPEPQTFAGGARGYSSGGLYDQAVAELQQRHPNQYQELMNLFINPTAQPTPTPAPTPTIPTVPGWPGATMPHNDYFSTPPKPTAPNDAYRNSQYYRRHVLGLEN